MAEAIVNVGDLLSQFTLTVRIPRLFGLRMWAATKFFELGARVSGFSIQFEMDEEFDPENAGTWSRYSEMTPDGGEVVLVRYPEGYRLRYHGETVWMQPR